MEIRQLVRLFTFGIINFLPMILGCWMTTILPEILQINLGISDPSERAQVGGFFYTSFYIGMIMSSFFWPKALDWLSKRNAVLIGLIFQGLFNLFSGLTTSLAAICFYRFMTGLFQNLSIVGKDFVFEFAKPSYRQYAYSMKTLFSFIGLLVGPFIGYHLYARNQRNFTATLLYMTELYFFGIVLFVLVFYLDFKEGDIAEIGGDEEERKTLTEASEEVPAAKQKGFFEMLRFCFHSKELRNITIVYSLTSGVNRALSFVTVFYLETKWEAQGLGLSSNTVTQIALYSFFPASAIVLLSPQIVPKHVSYQSFIRFFILAVAVALTFLPILRDLLPSSESAHIWTVYFCQGFINSTVPKIYSPFINYYVNKKVDKYGRSGANAVTFLGANLAASVFVSLIGFIFGYTMFDPLFAEFRTYSKYTSFLFLDCLLVLSFWLLVIKNK